MNEIILGSVLFVAIVLILSSIVVAARAFLLPTNEIAVRVNATRSLTGKAGTKLLDILADASATIAEGEVLQLTAAQSLSTDEDIYSRVIRGKTAALFAAATEVGGVIAGAPPEEIEALRIYGDALGMAFQIADDLLDYAGTDSIGKNRGDDFRERKVTLPVIRAVAAEPAERAFWVRVIEKGDQRDGDFAHALARMRATGALESSAATAHGWAAKARAALELFAPGPLRDTLSDLAAHVVARIA